MCVCMLSQLKLFVTPWTITHQAPLSMEISRQEYWSGLPCPPPGDLPDPMIEPTSLTSTLAGGFFTTSSAWEVLRMTIVNVKEIWRWGLLKSVNVRPCGTLLTALSCLDLTQNTMAVLQEGILAFLCYIFYYLVDSTMRMRMSVPQCLIKSSSWSTHLMHSMC